MLRCHGCYKKINNPPHTYCETCLKKKRDRVAKQKGKGICSYYNCTAKPMEGYKRCLFHTEYNREAKERAKERAKQCRRPNILTKQLQDYDTVL